MDDRSKNALTGRPLETGGERDPTDDGPVLDAVSIRLWRTAHELFADARGKVVYNEDILTPTRGQWSET